MKFLLRLLTVCLPLLCSLTSGDTLSPEAIQRLVDRGKYEKAVEALEAVVEEGMADGSTWYLLAYANHSTGDFAAAIEAGNRAIEFSSVRAVSLYNLACAYSLTGELESAEQALHDAMAVGFIDYGLMESDTDLEALRKAGRLPKAPPQLEYEVLRARNRLEVPYRLLLPDNFDSEREYPFVLAFAPGGHSRRDADWMISQLFADGMGERELITLVVMSPDPKKGWMTHPSHHALEDLLKKIRKDYSVRDNRFHFFGFLSGHRPAVTYSEMSGKYAAGLIVAAASPFQNWSDKDVRELAELPVTLIVGTQDDVNREACERIAKLLSGEASFEMRTIQDTGPVLSSLRGSKFVDLLAELVEAQSK